ncbi:MAG: integration host factor subunit beta [Deltaproteobacteria bacterium]|nr:integration host factor subunit beta [Deltaproteobacteria bacterium]
MNKSDLVNSLDKKLSHLSHRDVDTIIDTIFDRMTEALSGGDRIEIRGFGTFEIRVREPRVGRNPKSGAKVSIDLRKVPFFKAGKELKERLNKGGSPKG